MTEEERRECQVAAVTLQSISKLGLIVFLTIPIVFLLAQNHDLNSLENLLLLFFLFTGLLLGFRAWHIYFDSQLLKNIGTGNFELSDIDKSIYLLFRKKIQNKTLKIRIKSCYKLAKVFFLFLALHLICFLGIFIYFLFFASK
jgi:hypothetical protein